MKKLFLFVSAMVFAALQTAAPASSQEWPKKEPIKIIVPFSPGASNDTLARIMADYLAPRLGQAVVVENKPGAGSAIGTELVVNSKPDGYTLLWAASDGISVLPAVKPDLAYKVPDDFTFLLQTFDASFMVLVNSNMPVKTMQELVTYLKAHPNKVRFGSSGVGGLPHVGMALLEGSAGVKLVHVPYKGMSGVVTDLLGGHIDMAYVTPSTTAPQVGSGKIRVLATTASRRDRTFPDAPTLEEAGVKDAVVEVWFGVLGPAKLPQPIVDRLTKEMVGVLKDPEAIKKFANAKYVPFIRTGADFKKHVLDDLNKWKAVAKREKIVIKD
jgi:tripartite-type tricarboxylate transporter receptor subunit TctC